MQAIGRLKPGVTSEQARKEMETIAERLRELYPATNQNIGVELTPMGNQLVGNLRPIVLLVFAAVALVLLIACANVSNLLLAQAAGRQRELAIRAAIGAGRGRLIELPQSRYQTDEQVRNLYQQLTSRIQALPGVQQVGMIDQLPLSPSFRISRFAAEGQQPEPGNEPIAQMRMVDHRFFETMGIPRRGGRLFHEKDVIADNQVIINETMARRFFPNQDPVGKRIFMHFGSGDPTPVLVIGEVADIKDLGLDAPVEPEFYWPGVGREAILLARTNVDPLGLASAVRQAVQSTDPALPLQQVRSVEEILDASLARRRFTLNLLCASALLALVLAAIGIYGVVAYSVAQRAQEIGIRLSLGAQASDILKLVIGRGFAPALLGAACGLAGAFALARSLTGLTASLLFDVRATDPMTFAVIASVLLLVALLAWYMPARRATKVDPLTVLKHE